MGEPVRPDRAAWEGEMFRLLAENVLDYAIFIVDPHRHILSWSKGAERLLGFSEDEILGRRCDCFFIPEDARRGIPQAELDQALATGRGVDDRWHVRKDGSRFWSSGAVTPLRDEAGRLRGFAKIMRDRTEMKRAEDAAHERERQLHLLTDRAPVLIAHCDADRRYKFVNKPFAAHFGLHPRQIVGRSVRDVAGGPAYAAVEPHIAAALAGERVEVEVEVPYAGQEPQVMRCAYDPELDAGGRVVGFVAALVNVTGRKRAELALRESEARLRTLSDNLPQGAVYQVLGDPDGRRQFLYVSAGVERLFGLTPAEVVADAAALYGLIHEDDRPRVAAAEEAALRAAGPFDCEFRAWTRTGDLRWFHCRSAPRRLTTGQTVWEGVLLDVTGRKRDEALLESQNRVLERMVHGTPLPDVLEELCRTVEEQAGERLIATVLLLDEDGAHLRPVAGRRAPEGWTRAITPLRIGPRAGSCGTAAYLGERVVVEDVAADPLWVDFRDLASGYGLRACWSTPITSSQGQVVGTFAVYSDTPRRPGPGELRLVDLAARTAGVAVERRRAEEALRAGRERLVTALDASGTGTFRWDPATGVFLDFDDRLKRLFGLPADEPVRTTDDFLARVHPDDRPKVLSAVAACREGAGFELEYRAVLPGGGARWLYDRARMVRAAGGPPYLVGACTDITGRKRAEEEYRLSRERLDLVVNSVDVGLWYCDLPFDELIWNAKVKEHFGLPADAAVTIETFYERLHPDDRDRTRRAIDRSIRDRTPYDIEYRTVGLDGRERWVRAIGRTFYGPAGDPVRFDGVTVDVTERVRQEQALKDADRRKDEFLATLAHELRNPLAPLRTGLQVLRLARGDAAALEHAHGVMERQLAVMVRLIDDLLDVSRITRGKLPLRRRRVDLAGVVRDAVEATRPLIEAAAHHLTVTLPPEPVWLDADPTRLAQVFNNLLTNAAKYTDRGGRIRLAARRDGGAVVVSVRDTGIGIAPEHLPRVFETFSQVASALDRSQGGLGIGLSLVRGLVEMHGGTVEAHSGGPGTGSEFVVRLPVAADAAARPPEPPAGRAGPAGPRRRILVADDNRDAAESLAMMLRLGGHDVHTAHDGQAAVEAAGRARPDVAVLDIGMPRLNGYEACRRIREQPWGRGVVLVALTGWGQDEDKRRAAEAGFDHHLTKPLDPAALEALLAGLPGRG